MENDNSINDFDACNICSNNYFRGKSIFQKKNFFDLSDTTVLKGLFCIIVVIVHVPTEYQNPIQDAIGSFAYISVTFFFMTFSFGLMYSAEHKEGYIKKFLDKPSAAATGSCFAM